MPPGSGKAQLFTDTDYGGASATLEEGTYNLGDGTGTVKNDTVSSLKVAYGYQVVVYTDRDCKGDIQIFNADKPRLPSYLNDTISSVRVEREPDPGTEAKPSGPEGQQQVVFVQPP
jgi:hypothetical protein